MTGNKKAYKYTVKDKAKKTLREDILRYVKRKYSCEAEYLWARFPSYAVVRHRDNQKWFGLIMDVPREKLGLTGNETVDILNVKLGDPLLCDLFLQQEGYFPGYHLSSGSWITILLDGTVPIKEIRDLIDRSFLVTASPKTKQELRAPKEWIIPANPHYFDIVHAFDDTDTIHWKQGQSIKKGDTIYMYVGAPVSAILYECKVTETDIPYGKNNPNVNIKSLMKIKLQKRYDPEQFPFERLKNDYEIYAVRGPRGIPENLSEDLHLYGKNMEIRTHQRAGAANRQSFFLAFMKRKVKDEMER